MDHVQLSYMVYWNVYLKDRLLCKAVLSDLFTDAGALCTWCCLIHTLVHARTRTHSNTVEWSSLVITAQTSVKESSNSIIRIKEEQLLEIREEYKLLWLFLDIILFWWSIRVSLIVSGKNAPSFEYIWERKGNKFCIIKR